MWNKWAWDVYHIINQIFYIISNISFILFILDYQCVFLPDLLVEKINQTPKLSLQIASWLWCLGPKGPIGEHERWKKRGIPLQKISVLRHPVWTWRKVVRCINTVMLYQYQVFKTMQSLLIIHSIVWKVPKLQKNRSSIQITNVSLCVQWLFLYQVVNEKRKLS